jgi:hypothetical protein
MKGHDAKQSSMGWKDDVTYLNTTDSSRNLVIDVSYVAASHGRSMLCGRARIRGSCCSRASEGSNRTSQEPWETRQDLTGSSHVPDLPINEDSRVLAGLSTGFVQLLSRLEGQHTHASYPEQAGFVSEHDSKQKLATLFKVANNTFHICPSAPWCLYAVS